MSKSTVIDQKNSTNVRFINWQTQLLGSGLRMVGWLAPERAGEIAADLFTSPRRYPRPMREQRVIERGQRADLTWQGLRLAVWSWGAGPTILLVHGWEGRGAQLGEFVSPLVRAGYRVVTFDAPGHGDSEGQHCSLVMLAKVINAVAAAVAPIEAIIAHSMGAAATTVAISNGLVVDRLIYLAPPATISQYANKFARAFALSKAVAEQLEASLQRRFNVALSDLDGPKLATEMTTPLLIFHDLADSEVNWRDGQALTLAWPGAQLITTSGLGHRRILRSELVIGQAIAFLVAPFLNHQRYQFPATNIAWYQCAGCHKPILDNWDQAGQYCANCAMEQELFDRQARWRAYAS